MIDFKYLIEKDCNKNSSDDKNIGIKIINKNNINFYININNFPKKDNSKKETIPPKKDITNQINNNSNKRQNNLINNEHKIGENNNKNNINNVNIIRGAKVEDKPVIIIENKDNIENKAKPEMKNEHFQIINYIDNKEEITINKKNIYETFCIGVFISGLGSPIQQNSLIENSDNFQAPCGHPECSMFPSIEPELLDTFINKNSKIQSLPQTVSNMCFPLGIKPCFGCKFIGNGIENSPDPQKIQQTFFNVISNEKSETFYIATLQYFIKMTNQEYIMKYRFNPVTYVLDKIKNINNKDKKFKNNMQNISNLLNNSHVLIPESISLISKYPFFSSMEKCLRCLISLQNKEDMDNLINHIINEVPSPEKGFQIQFFIPRIEKPLILNHQYNKYLNYNKDINKISNVINNSLLSSSQINMKILLEKINIDNIIMIFQLLILEQRILFLENDYQVLSEISSVFLELIYPLIWTNPFLPIISTKTVRFLQSPVPFLMGLDDYLLKYAIDSKYITPSTNLETDAIIFNIMNNKFITTKTMKRIHKKDIYKEFKLPILPSKIREFIEKELKEIKKIKNNSKEIDKQIRNVFLKAMIMLIGDYNNFIFYTEDEIPLFNKDAFVESHKDKTSQFFLSEMVKTQIFNQFLLNEKQLHTKNKNKLKKILNKRNSFDGNPQTNSFNYELIDTSYFKKMIGKNQNLLNSEKIRNRAFSSKKNKKNKKIKDAHEDVDINNYLGSNDKFGSNINVGEVNHSIDFSKGKNKVQFNSNINISDAFSEKYNEENHLDNINKNKLEKIISRAKSAKRIINLNKEKEEKENEIENNLDEIKIALLYPYFLPKKNVEEIELENIKNDIEIYSQKNNLTFLIQNSGHVFIRHSYKLNNINQKRMYLLKKDLKENNDDTNNKILSKRNSKDNNININANKDINNINKNNSIDSNNNKDFIIIKDTFKLCYTNKKRITKAQLDLLEKIFLNEENKKYFSKLILPDIRMKKKKNHKLLTSSSFEDLSKILKISLEHVTSNEYNTCRLLTISSFVYYKIENKKLIYLYENYIRGIKPCRLWLFDEFWVNFFRLEFDEELKNKKVELNLFKYDSNGQIRNEINNEQNIIDNDKEEVLFEVISFTVEIMIKLKLAKKFIMDIFMNKIFEPYKLDKDKKNFFMQHILNLFNKI